MKYILIILLLLAAHSHAGLFDNDKEQIRQYQQQLNNERQSTGGWQAIAAVLAVGGITLFGIGTAIGSQARKEVKKHE
jgi:hypothetical protein